MNEKLLVVLVVVIRFTKTKILSQASVESSFLVMLYKEFFLEPESM